MEGLIKLYDSKYNLLSAETMKHFLWASHTEHNFTHRGLRNLSLLISWAKIGSEQRHMP